MSNNKKDDKSPTKQDLIKQYLSDLKLVIEMPGGAGVRFLRCLIGECGLYNNAYMGNVKTNFLLGRQSIGNKIASDLEQAGISKSKKADILL